MPRPTLQQTHPTLVASKWDKDRNDEIGLNPDKVSRGSTKKAWWRCSEGHSWFATVSSVANGSGCSYCSGKAVLPGFNDLASVRPDVVDDMWDWEENNSREIFPDSLTKSSGTVAHWRCRKCSYRWESRVVDVSRGYGCSVCGNSKVVPGINDLFTKRPDLLPRYNTELNGDLDVSKIGAGDSTVSLWWNCPKGHPYKSPAAVVAKGGGCGVCRGLQVHEGFNDLATLYPDTAEQWNYELNGDLTPSEVSYGSSKYVWFTCPRGHDRYVCIPDSYRFGCSQCVNHVSSPEIEVRDFVKSLLPEGEDIVASTRKVIPPKEIDIYVPSRNLAIEFNGLHWHSDYYKPRAGVDAEKARLVRDLGINFLTVWEDDWRDRGDVVKSQIRHRLGLQTESVYARKCTVREVDIKVARDILESNHIQGMANGTKYLGLIDQNGSPCGVAVITMKKNGEVELNRYATTKSVVGGMSKVVSYIEKTYSYKNLVTFADLQHSDGSLYLSTGWTLSGELPPDYKYLVGGKYRMNKRNFRLKRFKTDPTLKYEEGKTETELAQMNKLIRIYDCGKLRFTKPHPGAERE